MRPPHALFGRAMARDGVCQPLRILSKTTWECIQKCRVAKQRKGSENFSYGGRTHDLAVNSRTL